MLTEVGLGDAAAQLRPTSDRVREALFSMITSGKYGDPLRYAHVLDLFAGTGALGLEALSRGADYCTFVDDGRVAQTLIDKNILKLRRKDQTDLLKIKANALPPAPRACDLVFLDPPYGQGLGAASLITALRQGWIADAAVICWEERTPQPSPPGFQRFEQRQFGDTWITILQRND